MGQKAVFVDRDGTLNEMVYSADHGIMDSPGKPEQVLLLPGAADFLKGVKVLGFTVVVVTNQPGIAKGSISMDDLEQINQRLADLLREEGTSWDDLRFSPDHPDGGPWARKQYVKKTDCRKPQPGMLLQAAEELDLDLSASWMIGDGLTDVQAGKAAGCRTILLTKLKVGVVEKFLELKDAEPDFIAADMNEALKIVRDHSES